MEQKKPLAPKPITMSQDLIDELVKSGTIRKFKNCYKWGNREVLIKDSRLAKDPDKPIRGTQAFASLFLSNGTIVKTNSGLVWGLSQRPVVIDPSVKGMYED